MSVDTTKLRTTGHLVELVRLAHDAADELDRLRAEVARLRALEPDLPSIQARAHGLGQESAWSRFTVEPTFDEAEATLDEYLNNKGDGMDHATYMRAALRAFLAGRSKP